MVICNNKVQALRLKLPNKAVFVISQISRSTQVYVPDIFSGLYNLCHHVGFLEVERFWVVGVFVGYNNINSVSVLKLLGNRLKQVLADLLVLFFGGRLMRVCIFVVSFKIFEFVIIIVFVNTGCFFLGFLTSLASLVLSTTSCHY